MISTALLPMLVTFSLFTSTIERALVAFEGGDRAAAAAALDEAYTMDPGIFAANNLHYLRGRLAEWQADWRRAQSEFSRIDSENPLHELARWHHARAAARLGHEKTAEEIFDGLPDDFPVRLKMQLAEEVSEQLSLKIYGGMAIREARLRRAKLLGDERALWSLIADRKTDEVALEAANWLANSDKTPRQTLDLAEIFYRQRQFDTAKRLYQSLLDVPELSAEAHYQLARVYFQQQQYAIAIRAFQDVAQKFSGTDWEREAEYQIANCYWRLDDYRRSEKAYLHFLNKYPAGSLREGAIRNLIDVYRVLDEPRNALVWVERGLKTRVSVRSRQALLFSKAKILYFQNRYAEALLVARQLGTMRLRPGPNGTAKDEVRYFQGLCLSRMGRKKDAEAVWRNLAAEPFTYYGQKAVAHLNGSRPTEEARKGISRPNIATRPVRTAFERSDDAVAELIFLRLWDEASLWAEQAKQVKDYRLLAELAHRSGNFQREIYYAEQIRRRSRGQAEEDLLPMLYPDGFSKLIRDAAKEYQLDPLWVHAVIWQESRYNPFAKSPAGARGIMQFIPETANEVGRAVGLGALKPDQLYEVTVSIRLGIHYLASLFDKLKHPEMALAAYNGGIENVERWKRKAADRGLDFFVGDIGFEETKQYVMQVLKARAFYDRLYPEPLHAGF